MPVITWVTDLLGLVYTSDGSDGSAVGIGRKFWSSAGEFFDWLIIPLPIPISFTLFSLDRMRRKRNRKKKKLFWSFWLRFRRASDSASDTDFWFTLDRNAPWASDSDSASDSVASVNQPLVGGRSYRLHQNRRGASKLVLLHGAARFQLV